ncbi:MAG: imidazolonepropionase [Sulfolobales archaeon]
MTSFNADLIVRAKLVLSLPNVVRGRADCRSLGCVEDGAIAIRNGRIVSVGLSDDILRRYRARRYIDASGHIVTPGLVDPHTHLLYHGSREDEREEILGGVSYGDILARGGGILRTMRETSKADREILLTSLATRIDALLESGVTTVEVKTGYGLSPRDEARLLEILGEAVKASRVDIVPTLLAHVPMPGVDFKTLVEAYRDSLVPRALELGVRFIDVFCDRGAFNPEESRTILRLGRSLGLVPRIHADEFSYIGCSDVGLEVQAASLDHLNQTPSEIVRRIAASDSTAILAPSTALAIVGKKPPSRELLDLGAIVAIATDHSPALMNLNMVETINLAVNYLSIPPGNAIAAATVNAAHSLGLKGEVGSIVEGSKADLVIWSFPHYRWFGYLMHRSPIMCVIKNGVVVKNPGGCIVHEGL